ncbi:AAA family ATPase [Adhaeribacter soli]|uniref:EVE domain-containing protein n=1 Tax=Adhaeribacter soli TaxID=2607655 RepID=A0A5N1IYH9_9BACT|nr:AAA family ATPase [Adhaeribacter soli]KAA9338957.1 EVE domain-containing protein [Adhaeribacter soli]
MAYFELQKQVFDYLYTRHQKDNNFTFSVRKKFSKGKARNHFIGTEKSGYFGFTLWLLPCYYRGAAIDAATFIIRKIDKEYCQLMFQFNTSRKPVDEQNEATLNLGEELIQRFKNASIQYHTNPKNNKMSWIGVYKDQVPHSGLALALEELINTIKVHVDEGIKTLQAKYPNWHGGSITPAAFDLSIAKLISKRSGKVDLPPTLPPIIEPLQNISPSEPESINYWWLNCNPRIWRMEDYAIGQEQTYSNVNAKGNKRNVYENFSKVKPGDLLIGYESTPSKRVKAILEVTQELHQDDEEGDIFTFKVKSFVPNQLTWNQLQALPELANCRVMRNNQGSLFELSQNEYQAIHNHCVENLGVEAEKYDLDEADKELFIDRATIQEIKSSLQRKKNIILQGAPGVGKTFFAKRLAYLQMGKKDESRVEMIQFHQSYAYEDFIRGFRPNEEGKFTLANGIFFEFCRKAQNNPKQEYFFIIDEINRGNLSKIFGELLMLIEADKRGEGFAIPLTYRKENEPKFYVPENIYIIGTMNTADRSLALVDYALRRRFAFWNVVPKYEEKFKKFLQQNSAIDAAMATQIAERLSNLNKKIEQDKDLGVGFMVGHSYFCSIPKADFEALAWYTDIIDQEIKPLLQEYWYDNEAKAKEAIKILSLN